MRRFRLTIPLLFAAGLIAYKTRTSLAVLSSVWKTGVIAARPEVVSLGYQGAAVNARSLAQLFSPHLAGLGIWHSDQRRGARLCAGGRMEACTGIARNRHAI